MSQVQCRQCSDLPWSGGEISVLCSRLGEGLRRGRKTGGIRELLSSGLSSVTWGVHGHLGLQKLAQKKGEEEEKMGKWVMGIDSYYSFVYPFVSVETGSHPTVNQTGLEFTV